MTGVPRRPALLKGRSLRWAGLIDRQSPQMRAISSARIRQARTGEARAFGCPYWQLAVSVLPPPFSSSRGSLSLCILKDAVVLASSSPRLNCRGGESSARRKAGRRTLSSRKARRTRERSKRACRRPRIPSCALTAATLRKEMGPEKAKSNANLLHSPPLPSSLFWRGGRKICCSLEIE